MTISVVISEAAKAHAEALVSSGRYESLAQAVEAAIWQLDPLPRDDLVDFDALPPDVRAKIEAGIAAGDAGDVVDGETFLDELSAKYRSMIGR